MEYVKLLSDHSLGDNDDDDDYGDDGLRSPFDGSGYTPVPGSVSSTTGAGGSGHRNSGGGNNRKRPRCQTSEEEETPQEREKREKERRQANNARERYARNFVRRASEEHSMNFFLF